MTRIAAVLLFLAVAGCDTSTVETALAQCKIDHMEKAPKSMDGEYLTACMKIKGYKFTYGSGICGTAFVLASCYKPDSDMAIIRENIFGNRKK